MRTVLLYGHLAERFGRIHRYDVRSPAEAVRALKATLKGFTRAVIDGGHYRVLVGGRRALEARQLGDPTATKDTIRIVPVLAGAKKGGLLQTIVGVILVAVDYIYSYGSSGLSSVGWALIAGGVSQMLFAPPRAQQPPDRPDARASYAFDGAVNTAAQGNAVPICYGRVICGSQVISAGLAAEALSLDA